MRKLNGKKIKLFSLLLCVLFATAALAGCNGGGRTGEPPYDVEIITEGVSYAESESRTPLPYASYSPAGLADDVLPIMGFGGPRPRAASEGNALLQWNRPEVYQAIAEAGVNIMNMAAMVNYDVGNSGFVNSIIDAAWEAGLKTVVQVQAMINIESGVAAPVSAMTQILTELEKRPGFGGIYGKDEPQAVYFETIQTAEANWKKAAEAVGSDALIYWNAAGIGAPNTYYTGGLTVSMTYDEYLDYYVGIRPKYLISGHYPFFKDRETNGDVRSDYFAGISALRAKADGAGIPFWMHTQVGGNFDAVLDENEGNRRNTEGEFHWNNNTLLAYGAKGLAPFPLVFPLEWMTEGADWTANGLLNPNGTKNIWWHHMKKDAVQIKAIQSVLMKSKNVGVIAHGDSPAPVPERDVVGDGWRELQSVSGDSALIGCFDYNGKTAFYAVNNSTEKDGALIALNFDKKYGYDVIQRGETLSVAATRLPLKLNAGEGALVVLK
ncbi:MAG: hypothetical protein LBL66_03130 [Clostridiales bacterium]|jgi:hypothetical protein|nr:hypothetical protein [Clostridiales bacterium]